MPDAPSGAGSLLSTYLHRANPARLLGRVVGPMFAKRGKPPGTLILPEVPPTERSTLTVLTFDADHVLEVQVGSLDEIPPSVGVLWINLDGTHDVEMVRGLGEKFGLHPLLVEDVATVGQRPKFEEFDPYVFIVLHMLAVVGDDFQVDEEQVTFVLGDRLLLTFQERPGDVFEPVRERIRQGSGRLRSRGADYLCYALMDATVDSYFGVLERLGHATEAVDADLTADPGPETIRAIHDLKRETLILRRSVWPLREVLASFARCEASIVTEETQVFLRDVYDHAIHVIDTTESMRDVVAGMMDLYLSLVGNRTNEVMRVLTVMASLFIPLTFLAGVYGMNFHYMPELALRWAYPALLGLMGVVAAALLIYFKRKGWL